MGRDSFERFPEVDSTDNNEHFGDSYGSFREGGEAELSLEGAHPSRPVETYEKQWLETHPVIDPDVQRALDEFYLLDPTQRAELMVRMAIIERARSEESNS